MKVADADIEDYQYQVNQLRLECNYSLDQIFINALPLLMPSKM